MLRRVLLAGALAALYTLAPHTLDVAQATGSCHGSTATITDSPGAHTIFGTASRDIIDASDGGDIVWAGGGDDLVCGGTGDDYIHGEAGADNLDGEAGNDHVFGEGDNDTVSGDFGTDEIDGNNGADVVQSKTVDSAADTLDGGPGADELDLAVQNQGGNGAEDIYDGDGFDFTNGEEDNLDELFRCADGNSDITPWLGGSTYGPIAGYCHS